MRTVRIVNYAVNGSGVGHLTRLIAINRWIRRFAAHAGVKAEIWFLTSSEADGLLLSERFASFKMPSKSVVGDAGIDKLAYLALAKQWVWHSLGLLRPDVLVVDTFPRGSFGELLSALDLAKTRAFVYRPTKDDFAKRPDFQAMLPLYDSIVVPEHEADAPVRVPESVRARMRYVGPVFSRERAELRPREDVRRRFGIAEEDLAVYVTAGGGGDPGAEEHLLRAVESLATLPRTHVVCGAGPLYRGATVHARNVTWLPPGPAAEWMRGFDVAVCAAGYNTFFEAMHAGLPCVFLPQEKIADDQFARADRAVQAGAAVRATLGSLPEAVGTFRDASRRRAASQAAASLAPANAARVAAAEILKLALPSADVDAAEEAIDEGVLLASRELDLGVEPFVEAMRLLGERGEAERRVGQAEPAAVARAAVGLLRVAHELGLPASSALRMTGLLSRKLVGSPDERAAAAERVFRAFRPFDDWAGAAALLKLFGTERELPACAFAERLAGFLEALARENADLYRGIARLTAAIGTRAEPPSNADVLRAASLPSPRRKKRSRA